LEITSFLPELKISTLETLDDAYQRVIDLLRKNDFNVYEPSLLNDLSLAKDFSKIFNLYDPEREIRHTFFVITEPWDDDKINKILNSFSQPDPQKLVYFLSAFPLPGILEFITKNTPAAFFELESLRNLKTLSILPNEPEKLEQFANRFTDIAEKCFQQKFTGKPPEDLKTLEKIIIEHYRNNEPYEYFYEDQFAYLPDFSLNFMGIFLAWLLVKNFSGSLLFSASADPLSLAVGFALNAAEEFSLMAHPLEKVQSFFYRGKDYSIINWYYEIKFFLKTKKI